MTHAHPPAAGMPDGGAHHTSRLTIAPLGVSAPAEVLDAVVSLWERCGLTRPWNPPRPDLDRALADPAAVVLVAWEDAEEGDEDRAGGAGGASSVAPVAPVGSVGSVMAGFDGHRGWLYYLAVDPERRGSGVARALVERAESWLADRGARKVQLMVRAGNPAASLYPHLGYEAQDVEVYGRWLAGG